MTAGVASRTTRRLWLLLIALAIAVWFAAPSHAQPEPKPAKPVTSAAPSSSVSAATSADAAPPAPPTPKDPAADALGRTAARVRALIAGELDVSVDPATLFDIAIADEAALAVERRRVAAVLARAHSDAARGAAPVSDGGATTAHAAGAGGADAAEAALRVTDPVLWRARIALDEARFAFYQLTPDARAAALAKHAERQVESGDTKTDKALDDAEREAQAAEAERQAALDAVKRARNEAERMVAEELARLLAVTRSQAEFRGSLIEARRAANDGHGESLALRRDVNDAIAERRKGAGDAADMDARYVALRARLGERRDRLAEALDGIAAGDSAVPTAGPDPLTSLPAEVDRGRAATKRTAVDADALALALEENAVRDETARLLMGEVEMLNRVRLDLVPVLSPATRSDLTGFGPAGLDQARTEFATVWLTLRYHLHSTMVWIGDVRGGDADARGDSALAATLVALKWLVPIVAFIWWRRRAERVLKSLRDNIREAERKRHGATAAVGLGARAMGFVIRIHGPLEWLLLLWSVVALLPEDMKKLLEVQLVSTVFSWTLGGSLIVTAIDALSSDEVRGPRRAASATITAHLRLRSLRLCGRAIVTFGLILALSDKLVGRGTIYQWVFSTCWFAAIPLFLVIIAWWKPVIFERVELVRKKGPIQQWILANRDGTASFGAAIAGGTYLFAMGAWRVLRSWVVSFTVTRHVLAYLFRRGMSKKAETSEVIALAPLDEAVAVWLGPETPSTVIVPSVADTQVKMVMEQLDAPGGGVFAIVGERGAGKTTLVDRIARSSPEIVRVSCPVGGIQAFEAALVSAVLDDDADPADVAAAVERLEGKFANGAVIIDDAHHLILPMMGGLDEFDRVLALARDNSSRCSWVFAVDEVVWRFFERARGATPLFDDVIRLQPWKEEGIARLLNHRNELANISPSFEQLVTDLPEDADDIDVREALERTEASYYRLLWDYASGNPGVALHFWRHSLGVDPDGGVCVRLFKAPDAEDLQALPDPAVFVLRAIVQLGWASFEQICDATALAPSQVKDALRYGTVRRYFDIRTDGRIQITWRWFRAITRFLERRHLIFHGELTGS